MVGKSSVVDWRSRLSRWRRLCGQRHARENYSVSRISAFEAQLLMGQRIPSMQQILPPRYVSGRHVCCSCPSGANTDYLSIRDVFGWQAVWHLPFPSLFGAFVIEVLISVSPDSEKWGSWL